jgi:hypothetical protein
VNVYVDVNFSVYVDVDVDVNVDVHVHVHEFVDVHVDATILEHAARRSNPDARRGPDGRGCTGRGMDGEPARSAFRRASRRMRRMVLFAGKARGAARADRVPDKPPRELK